MQSNKPLACYTRKLNAAQRRYSTGEQELLSIVETLKAFESTLMGQRIIVHTDHLNLLYRKLATGRLIRWRMLLEEFGPEFEHIKGEKNVVADALSRLDMSSSDYDTINDIHETRQLTYVTNTDIESEEFPMSPELINKYQSRDKRLLRKAARLPNYDLRRVEKVKLIHFKGRIYVPEPLQERILSWYHNYLVHPDCTNVWDNIKNILLAKNDQPN